MCWKSGQGCHENCLHLHLPEYLSNNNQQNASPSEDRCLSRVGAVPKFVPEQRAYETESSMPVPPGYFKLDSYSIPVSSCLKLPLAVLISILFLIKESDVNLIVILFLVFIHVSYKHLNSMRYTESKFLPGCSWLDPTPRVDSIVH